MRALVFRRHGGPEVLEPADLPDPQPAAGEVRIALRAAALNHLDIWVRGGLGADLPMPHIGGSDGAGIVEAVAPGVTSVAPGDRVMIAPGLSCGDCPECLAGRESRCPAFHILGVRTQGTYATHVVVPAANCLPLPPGMPFPEAASIPLVFLTAYHMLFTRGQLRPGETVHVPGCGSGVGTAAIQLAAAAGARVIAAGGGAEKCELAKKLGAWEALDSSSNKNIGDELRRLTGGRGADLVVDHIGGDHTASAAALCARGGRVVVCGATAGKQFTLPLRSLYVPEVSILGAYMGSRWELVEALRLIAQGKARPVIDRTFPLAQAADAQRRMEARQNIGKVVLIP
ncbi:MAG: zinc-binding dehydrogenase [Planctomycetes bacterium]|nr:zinc-binding dehydrogenase [Planctomycetota bacterium]